jgi:hypothetical protein
MKLVLLVVNGRPKTNPGDKCLLTGVSFHAPSTGNGSEQYRGDRTSTATSTWVAEVGLIDHQHRSRIIEVFNHLAT